MNEVNVKAQAGDQRIWSLELMLVIGLPLSAVIGGIITVVIAFQSGYTPDTDAGLDRFARPAVSASDAS